MKDAGWALAKRSESGGSLNVGRERPEVQQC
jgi:hypothetical protein